MPDIAGTVPQWISAGSLVTLIGISLRYLQTRRAQTLSAEEEIRDHYKSEVDRLTQKVETMEGVFRRALAEAEERAAKRLDDSEQRHEECMKDRDALRQRVAELEKDIDGLVRLIAANSAGKVLKLGPDVSPHIKSAAERVAAIMSNDSPRSRS